MDVNAILSVGKLKDVESDGYAGEAEEFLSFQIISRSPRVIKVNNKRPNTIQLMLSDSETSCTVVLSKNFDARTNLVKSLKPYVVIDVKKIQKNEDYRMLELLEFGNVREFSEQFGSPTQTEPPPKIVLQPYMKPELPGRSRHQKYLDIKKVRNFPIIRNIAIHGRVTSKEDVQLRANNNRVMSFVLQDTSAPIKCVAWNDTADKMDRVLKLDKGYSLKGFDVKAVSSKDREWNHTRHPFEIKISADTTILDNVDAEHMTLPKLAYTEIPQIPLLENENIVNVRGVVVELEPARTVMIKGLQKITRSISVVDTTGYMISLRLWKDVANFQFTKYEPYCFNHFRVNRSSGLNLTTLGGSAVLKDDSPTLKSWWTLMGSKMDLKHVREMFDNFSSDTSVPCLTVMTALTGKPYNLPYKFNGVFRLMKVHNVKWAGNCIVCKRKLNMEHSKEKRVTCLECQAMNAAPLITYNAAASFADHTGTFNAIIFSNIFWELCPELFKDADTMVDNLQAYCDKNLFFHFHVQGKVENDKMLGYRVTLTGLSKMTVECLSQYISKLTRRQIVTDLNYAKTFRTFWNNNGNAILPVRLSQLVSLDSINFLNDLKHNNMSFVAVLEGISQIGKSVAYDVGDGDDCALTLTDPGEQVRLDDISDIGKNVEVIIEYSDNDLGVSPFLLTSIRIIDDSHVDLLEKIRVQVGNHYDMLCATFRQYRYDEPQAAEDSMDVDMTLSPSMSDLGLGGEPNAKKRKY